MIKLFNELKEQLEIYQCYKISFIFYTCSNSLCVNIFGNKNFLNGASKHNTIGNRKDILINDLSASKMTIAINCTIVNRFRLRGRTLKKD